MQAKLKNAQAVIQIQDKQIEAQRRHEQDLISRLGATGEDLKACSTKLSKAESEKKDLEERRQQVERFLDRLLSRVSTFSTSSVSLSVCPPLPR